MADNWISNIVAGGISNRAGGSSFSTTSGDTGDESNFLGEPFDNTFTDMPGGGMNPHGFFATGGGLSLANTQHYNKHSPVVSTHGFHTMRKIGNMPMSGDTTQLQLILPVVYSPPKVPMDWNKLHVLTIMSVDSADDKRRKNITNQITITILGLTIGSMILIQ